MSSKHSGGRVYAGEDSEDEDEEEEIAYSFQFSSSATQQSAAAAPTFGLPTAAAAPRFSVQAPAVAIAAPTGNSDEESDEDEDESDEDASAHLLRPSSKVSPPVVAVTAPTGVSGEDSEDDGNGADDSEHDRGVSQHNNEATGNISGSNSTAGDALRLDGASPLHKPALLSTKKPSRSTASTPAARVTRDTVAIEDNDAHWTLNDTTASRSGVDVMGDAIVARLQPSLDVSIERIAELIESQQHLLQLLAAQRATVCANEQIQKVATVMDKLPHVVRKVQDLKAAMADISASVEKMKKRAESLRVDAQSHAIKKANKRDSMSQWNKMVAATTKSADSSVADNSST